ncbi:MAG: type II toxin-antitoxin system RelE/ParE family toxin [Spirulina sp.]
MVEDSPEISVRFSVEFEKKLKRLSKKYRNIYADIEPIIILLQAGNQIGDRVQGFGEEYSVYKVRVKNSNLEKGKSAGYRVIYLLQSETSTILLTIYSKSEQEDITIERIKKILADFD